MSEERPVFDFEGGLDQARSLFQLAEDLDQSLAMRAKTRDAALLAWEGPEGDEFRARAEIEDAETLALLEQLRDQSTAWSAAYVSAVTDMNAALYEEALIAQAAHLQGIEDAAWADMGNAEKVVDFLSDLFGGDTDATSFVADPRNRELAAPAAPLFEAPIDAFAQFFREGDFLDYMWVSSVPHGELY